MSSWSRYPFSPPAGGGDGGGFSFFPKPYTRQIPDLTGRTAAVPERFVEVDPSGRYGRYSELLGSGALKKVYRGFDEEEGMEVAWNQVRLEDFSSEQVLTMDRLYTEITLLEFLEHENVVGLYGNWMDDEKSTFNFVTELCVSGDLRSYLKRHSGVSMRAVKKWARQILEGLEYLHGHEPCVIHGDLNCSNIFINGNQGKVKIGDLSTASILRSGETAVIAYVMPSAEYMAPELYDDDEYNELVDIYSFGLCLLEMVTHEIPYRECKEIDKIHKVTTGQMPSAMDKVKDPSVRAFIEKCLVPPLVRPSASELLKDSFFRHF